MTILRLTLISGLLAVFPLLLTGCGQGDGGEYRPYSDSVDGAPGTATPIVATKTETTAPLLDASPVPSGDPVAVAAAPAETLDRTPISVPLAPDLPTAEIIPVESTTAADSVANAAGTPGTIAVNGADAPPAAPREIKLLVPDKTFRAVGPEGALRVTYDDLDLLKVLNMEPVTVDAPEHFPPWLTDLEGKRIRLRGYMRPDLVAEGLTGFILARDTQACCFGPNTKAYDIIPTMLREGVTTDYIELRPFDVVGVFHIEVMETRSRTGERKVEFLYNIDDAVIIQL